MTDDTSTDHRRGQSSCCAEAVAVDQLAGQRFIRLGKNSKRPIAGEGPEKGPFFRRNDREILYHANSGGNVGRVTSDDLLILDVDRQELEPHITHLPETLEIGTKKGRHLWFSCPKDIGSTISITDPNDTEIGSIRTGNAYALVPPSVHPSGEPYQILENREIATVSRASLMGIEPSYRQTLETTATAQHRREDPAAGSSLRSGVVDALSFVNHDERRAELADVLCSSDPSHNRRQWLVGFLSYVGLDAGEITDLIMDHADWSDLDRQITSNQVRSVLSSGDR